MNPLVTTIDIDAPAEVVWAVLTDFDSYPEWNRHSIVSGTLAEGETLRVAPGPDAGRMPTFTPTVVTVDEGHEFAWLGHLFVRGLFDGEHRFQVEDLGEGRTRLTQSESFSGVLAGLVLRVFGEQTRRNFEGVNAAVKARAESTADATTESITT
ncbi:SRPBCC domain-containing protein [Haloarchaeobius sp. HME9146]|uniref:SRPBCC domain-containing protein n=1 Tax=Haloarchaeobius sp. HME9146 TaxID=2978732 RepID=UPI0021C1347F|nr:SRPBCC domain-containing protein [Haloarchaeobius sp. HME9146]MCT9097386.1 SRPBCC domain-containing protein [Haloarchaeobius sp. HME9146]